MAIPSTMKAVVLHGADDMRVQPWPVPELGPGEVLLKVEVASICGTDVKVLHRKLQGQPEGQFIMGHEYAGTVAALGPGVDEFRVGDRVAVEVHKGCERCENCIKGWYTSCLNYGNMAKGHRAKGLTCDGGFRRVCRQPHQHALPPARQSHLRAGLHGHHGRLASVGPRSHGRLHRRRDRADPQARGPSASWRCSSARRWARSG